MLFNNQGNHNTHYHSNHLRRFRWTLILHILRSCPLMYGFLASLVIWQFPLFHLGFILIQPGLVTTRLIIFQPPENLCKKMMIYTKYVNETEKYKKPSPILFNGLKHNIWPTCVLNKGTGTGISYNQTCPNNVKIVTSYSLSPVIYSPPAWSFYPAFYKQVDHLPATRNSV